METIKIDVVKKILSRCFPGALNGECWFWMGAENKEGYGIISVKGKKLRVHRVMYVAFRGEVGDGEKIWHTCKHTKCVNPLHLETDCKPN